MCCPFNLHVLLSCTDTSPLTFHCNSNLFTNRKAPPGFPYCFYWWKVWPSDCSFNLCLQCFPLWDSSFPHCSKPRGIPQLFLLSPGNAVIVSLQQIVYHQYTQLFNSWIRALWYLSTMDSFCTSSHFIFAPTPIVSCIIISPT